MTVYELDNGARVVIKEDHFAPVAALQIWVKAGGADELESELGVAHVHEHMLFKGTEKRGLGEIAAADGDMAAGVDFGGVRKQLAAA